MHKLINPDFKEILKIYSEEFPDFLLPFFEAKCIKRISEISQHCWSEYSNFFNYRINVSRFEHSLWVALIIWNFTKDKKQTLAWLFHDISHSVFSHVWDFLLWDAENQESSELYTTEILQNDEIIMKELKNLWIKLEEVDNYEIYPIADNPGPQLAADRLEYSLSWWYELWTISLDEIKEIYDNLEILINENWENELGFSDKKIALKFWVLALNNDQCCFSSYESVVSMSFLSEILKVWLTNKLFNSKDLYTLTDPEIIEIIKNSKNNKISEMWEYYTNLSSYKIDRIKIDTNSYCVSSSTKRRYIDPLIKTENWIFRLSNFSTDFCEKKDYHTHRTEEWIRLDYKI